MAPGKDRVDVVLFDEFRKNFCVTPDYKASNLQPMGNGAAIAMETSTGLSYSCYVDAEGLQAVEFRRLFKTDAGEEYFVTAYREQSWNGVNCIDPCVSEYLEGKDVRYTFDLHDEGENFLTFAERQVDDCLYIEETEKSSRKTSCILADGLSFYIPNIVIYYPPAPPLVPRKTDVRRFSDK